MMAVDTRQAARRALRYESFADLARDLDAIEEAHRSGRLRTTGNWTASQIMEHLAKFANCAFDGFPGRAPWIVRKAAKLLFKRKILSGEPMPPGFKIPRQASFMVPSAETTTEEGIAMLRLVLARLDRGDRFTAESPIFERLSHEEWCRAQLGHAAMHMSFIEPGDG